MVTVLFPHTTCACVRCVRLRSWSVACPPFLPAARVPVPCAACVSVPRTIVKLARVLRADGTRHADGAR
eukprot:6305672-Prymnesium_polylepis.1